MQGSPQVEVTISPEPSLHKKVHKVQSFCRCPKAGAFLWGVVFATVSVPSCMLAFRTFVCRWKSLKILRFVAPMVLLGVIQLWREDKSRSSGYCTYSKNYKIFIAGIQETKRFGSDIWPIGEWTFLCSGYALPVDSDAVRRNGLE